MHAVQNLTKEVEVRLPKQARGVLEGAEQIAGIHLEHHTCRQVPIRHNPGLE